jgi:hypothetical protein
MPINVGLGRTFPGMGVSVDQPAYTQLGVALTAGANTITIPATGTILGTTVGKIRLKIYGGAGTSPTVVSVAITATDGTNTVYVGSDNPSAAQVLSSTKWYDRFFEYLVDAASVTSGAGSANGQLLPGGATKFTLTITLGGTSETGLADIEIRPLI